MRYQLLFFLFIWMQLAWTKLYQGPIKKNTRPHNRRWGGMSTNTGSNMGGWLIRITNSDGAFACCGSYYAPLLVLTSANCIEPFQWSLEGVIAEGTAMLDDEPDNYAEVETVYVPDEFEKSQTFMDIAIVRLRKPIKGKLTEFIALCHSWHLPGTEYNAFAWGYSSFVVQKPTSYPRTGIVPYEDFDACEDKFTPGFLSSTVICVAHPKDRRQCLYDGGSPLVTNNELCGIASVGPSCQNTSRPGVYTSIIKVKWFIWKIERSIKSGDL